MYLMIVLISYFFIISFLLTKKSNTIFLLLAALPIFIMSAFRSINVGNDTVEYVRIFDIIKNRGTINGLEERFEIGYLWVTRLATLLSEHYYVLLILCAVLVFSGTLYFIKNYSFLPGFSLAIFFLLRYFDTSMNAMRISIAIAISMVAFSYLIKEKKILFIIFTLLAMLFHTTAIALLVLLILDKIKLNFKNTSIVFLSTIIIVLFFDRFLQIAVNLFPLYSYYFNTAYLDNNVRLATLMSLLLNLSIIVLLVLLKKYQSKTHDKLSIQKNQDNSIDITNRADDLMFKSLIMGVAVLLISTKFNLLNRVADYFLIYSIVILPNRVAGIKDYKYRNLFIYLILIVLIVYYVIIIYFRPEWNKVYPFEFFRK